MIDLIAKVAALSHRLFNYQFLRGHIRFLCYHSIMRKNLDEWIPCSTIWADIFESHLQYLKNNDIKVLSMPQALEILTGKKICYERMVCITFDDGYRNNLTVAWPLIKSFGYTAHFFLTSDAIGKKEPYNWDLWMKGTKVTSVPDTIPDDSLPLSEREVSLLSSEDATFGSHGMYHMDLRKLSQRDLKKQICEPRERIEFLTKQKINTFAYPFGYYNIEVIKTLRNQNYQWGFSVRAGRNKPGDQQNQYRINRTSFTKNGSLHLFKRVISGGYDFIRLKDIFHRAP